MAYVLAFAIDSDALIHTAFWTGITAIVVTVLLVALSPVGFFLLAPYTEALFLATTAASFWFARERHPWLAGIAGAAAGLTRLQGGLLLLPLGYVAWRDLQGGSGYHDTTAEERD